jgi:TolB-like protein
MGLLSLRIAGWPSAPEPEAGSPRSVAVLPLANLSGDPAQDYMADGLTEALIADLSTISSLRVISRTSVMRYKDAGKPLADIARELGVQTVLEGSVQRSTDRVRINVRLIDATADRHLWSERYERAFRDVLSLQTEIAAAVSREVRVALTPEEQARPAGGPMGA